MRSSLVRSKNSTRAAKRLATLALASVAVAGLAGQRAALAQYVTQGPQTQTISFRLTDFTDPVNTGGSLLTFNRFDTLGGTRQLLAVQISLVTAIRSDVSVTNNSPDTISGNVTIRVRAALYDPFGTFSNPGVIGNTIQPGAFVAQADAVFDTPTIFSGQTVSSPPRSTNGSTNPAAVQGSATLNRTFSVAGYGGPVSGTNVQNAAFVNNFVGNGTVDFGAQTFTRFIADYGGGNATVNQSTDAEVLASITYVYQPVPAPPPVISLGIGSGVLGLAQLGAVRLRRRGKKKCS